MSIIFIQSIEILSFILLFYSINSQINVLAPPTIVQKVKELEDGSKLKINNLI